MKVRFETGRFEASWGKKPRGTGGWAFEHEDGQLFTYVYGTFTKAKAVAARRARERGVTVLVVAS